MLRGTQLIGFGSGRPRGPVTLNLRGTTPFGSTSGLSAFSFTNVSIGTPSAFRRVICLIAAKSPNFDVMATSVTIGGVTATIDVQKLAGTGTNTRLAVIASAIVPTGTTATITANFNDTLNGVAGVVTVLDNVAFGAIRVGSFGATSVSSGSVTINREINGALIAVAMSGLSPSFTWSNATEYLDTNTNGVQLTTADTIPCTDSNSVTVTVTPSTSVDLPLCVAIYR